MTDLDKMAREMSDNLDTELFKLPDWAEPADAHRVVEYAIRTALLTAPPGYVLVPVEPTEELALRIAKAMQGSEQLGWTWEDCSPIEVEGWMDLANAAISAIRAAAPEVK